MRNIAVLLESGVTLDFKGCQSSERGGTLTIFRDKKIIAQFPPSGWDGVYYATP